MNVMTSENLETRAARRALPISKKPYYINIGRGVSLGYRRNKTFGSWSVRVADGNGSSWLKAFADADDNDDAHGLTFKEAKRLTRALAARMKTSFIYIIGAADGGPVKIGRSANPSNRLAELQTGHHQHLQILASFPGDQRQECDLHFQFIADHIKGEWFHRSPAICTFMESLERREMKMEGPPGGGGPKTTKELSQQVKPERRIETSRHYAYNLNDRLATTHLASEGTAQGADAD